MNLLRKYYDGLADLPTGGGIPDEVRRKIDDMFPLEESPDYKAEAKENHAARFGYSLASEEKQKTIDMMNKMINKQIEIVKEKNEEISRLKAENERLRGDVESYRNRNERGDFYSNY